MGQWVAAGGSPAFFGSRLGVDDSAGFPLM
jgi:hypothetical protein